MYIFPSFMPEKVSNYSCWIKLKWLVGLHQTRSVTVVVSSWRLEDNPEGNNENKSNTKPKSLLNFIINKESSVDYLMIFSIKLKIKTGSRDDEAKRGHLRRDDQAGQGLVSSCKCIIN